MGEKLDAHGKIAILITSVGYAVNAIKRLVIDMPSCFCDTLTT